MIRPSRAGLGSDMLGQWRGVRASYSPHQAGLQGLRRMGWDPRIQLTVGALGMAMHPPTLSSAGCGVQGVVGWVPGYGCIGPGLLQVGVLSDQCNEIEENNRMGKTRDLFNKIRDTKGTFQAKMGIIRKEMAWT